MFAWLDIKTSIYIARIVFWNFLNKMAAGKQFGTGIPIRVVDSFLQEVWVGGAVLPVVGCSLFPTRAVRFCLRPAARELLQAVRL